MLDRNDPALVSHHLSHWLGPNWGDGGLEVNAGLYLKVQQPEAVLYFLHPVLLKGSLRNTLPWLTLSTACITQVHFFTQVQIAAPPRFPWCSLPGEQLRKRRVVGQTLVSSLAFTLSLLYQPFKISLTLNLHFHFPSCWLKPNPHP